MLSPTQTEVAQWIVDARSPDPMTRDLSASCLAAYIAQIEEINRYLSKQVVALRNFQTDVTEALALSLQPTQMSAAPAEKTATLVPPTLLIVRGGA